MATSSKTTIRSISLPTRSHPTTLRIEEELNKLKSWEASAATPTAESICNGLLGLGELYESTNELLNLPVTQQVLCHHQHEKWVNELLDGSVKLLDICGNTIDAMSQMKEHLGDLQSCLRRRRRKGDLSLAKFTSFRKKMKKDVKRLISVLKQMDNQGSSQILNLDHHLSVVIRVLREVQAISISIFQSLLVFLSLQALKPNSTKWSLVSKLMGKGTVTCEGQLEVVNQLERVDSALSTLCKYGSSEPEKLQIARSTVEELETCAEEIEGALACIYRRLIKTRASLLNIISS